MNNPLPGIGSVAALSSAERLALLLFCAATVLLVPLGLLLPGLVAWVAAAAALLRATPAFRSRIGILLGAVLMLAMAPINTERDNAHFLHLGVFFSGAVIVPAMLMRRLHPGVVDWRFWPRRFQWLDVIYVAISIPLAWAIIRWYFFTANPELPTHWPMPETFSGDAKWRLIVGINCVGIWDELFFVNTVYAILRSLMPAGIANLAQAVVYTSVLYSMAFTGVGPIVVYVFALTQGAMYERSKCLLYVLIVHLIVDAFLVAAILEYYYPDSGFHWF